MENKDLIQERNEAIALTISDLALYLGQDFMIDEISQIYFDEPREGDYTTQCSTKLSQHTLQDIDQGLVIGKLMLRPLMSMVEQEELLLRNLRIYDINGTQPRWFETPLSIRALLAWGFDVFGWIEKGLAIEKKETATCNYCNRTEPCPDDYRPYPEGCFHPGCKIIF